MIKVLEKVREMLLKDHFVVTSYRLGGEKYTSILAMAICAATNSIEEADRVLDYLRGVDENMTYNQRSIQGGLIELVEKGMKCDSN